MKVTRFPVATNEIIFSLMTTTLPIEDVPTRVKVVDHLAVRYVAWLNMLMLTLTEYAHAHLAEAFNTSYS